MKTLAMTKYRCPKCKKIHEHEEWSSDDRSRIYELLCDDCKVKSSSLFVKEIPSYRKLAEKIDESSMDAKNESAVFDIISSERQKELQSSKKARDYEEGRRREWQNYKKEWVKRGRNVKELSDMQRQQQ